MSFIEKYNNSAESRAKDGVPPLPLDAKETAEVAELLKKGGKNQEFLLNLLENRVSPGVDDAAYVKAAFLNDIVKGDATCTDVIDPIFATVILGTMLGGFNVSST